MTPLPERLLGALDETPMLAYRAPGRANLIGEHTDYNDGYVLPVALELATYVAGRRVDGLLRLRSLDQDGEVVVDLRTLDGPEKGWGRYARAVVRSLHDAGVPLAGFAGVVASELPPGSGLGSSAALEVAIALVVTPGDLAPVELARICRRAENDYVGVRCGIMDQLASAGARPGHALLIDCRDESVSHVSFPEDDLGVLVVDSGVARALDDGAYNRRRRQCETAARALGIKSLRSATAESLARLRGEVDGSVYRRARHVITENQRVLDASEALRTKEYPRLGELFAASHESLASDFEVSVPELDSLVGIAAGTEGVVAARLTGAGFGGCTVNLVERAAAGRAAAEILDAYRSATGRGGRAWLSAPAPGAAPVSPPGS